MPLSGIVLVTGGAGFIGSHIASAFDKSGARVRVLDDLTTGYQENIDEIGGNIDFIKGSVANPETLKKAIDGVELIFHEAAIPSVPRSVKVPRESHDASVEGTFSLLLAAKEKNVRRVIYAASSSAYGNQVAPSKSEAMRPDPLSPYAVAKLVGEYYCQVFTRCYGLETVSLRYFNVFGPRQDPSSEYSGVVSKFISALFLGEQPVIYGTGEQSRDFTYIDNVVAANLSAAEAPNVSGKVINVANGNSITVNQLLDELKNLTGKHDVTPVRKPAQVGDVESSQADITLARELLNYEMKVDLREGLRRTIDWWKSSRFGHR